MKFPKYPDIWGISPSTHTLKAFFKFKRESEGRLFPNKYISQQTNNFPNVFGKFSKILGTWEISQMPGYLGNFPNAWVSGKFPKYLQIFEAGKFLSFWKFLKWLEIFKIPRHLGNFQNARVSGKFPKCLGSWEISQMPGYLGNFPNIQSFEKFPKS